MTRTRTITFGAVNITLPPPHSPDHYLNMFIFAYEQARKAPLRGDWVGLLGQMRIEDHPRAGKVMRGEFYKYVDLDTTRAWYNVVSRKPAERKELAKIVIPDELKPHFQFLPFVFFAKGHRLICLTHDGKDSMPPRQVADVLRVILRTKEIQEKFGTVDVTVEPSLETLDEIFRLPKLRKLELDVTRPNPDDFSDFEQDFLDEMEEQNAASLKVELIADRGETLVPNEKTKKLAKLAQSNGKVVGVGGTRGKTRTLSTSRHPFEKKESYLPDVETRSDVVLAKALGIFERLMNRT